MLQHACTLDHAVPWHVSLTLLCVAMGLECGWKQVMFTCHPTGIALDAVCANSDHMPLTHHDCYSSNQTTLHGNLSPMYHV